MGFKNIEQFKFWCNKILPLVYDDSLSYYELLCKVVNSLNEVINDVNSLPDYIAELVSDERLKEILKTLLNSLEEQIASANEGTSETATDNRIVGELVWLNGYLYRVVKVMNSGDKYVVGSNIEKITVENLLEEIKSNITSTFESDYSIASANRNIGDLIWLNNDLYEITHDIAIGTKYIIGTNCRKVTINELLNEKVQNEADAREQADNALGERISNEADAREQADNALGERISNETDAREQADNALKQMIANNSGVYVDVTRHGLINDGTTDNTNAFRQLFADYPDGAIFYFPNGNYLFNNSSFDIDCSKYTLLGEDSSQLISKGLSAGAYFINIVSPISLKQYDYPRIPLMNISLIGNYFTDMLDGGVLGIKMGTDETLVAPHLAFYNVVIRNFGYGLALTSAYKTSYYNLSIIACNVGIFIPSTGVQQAVPCNFYSIWMECCNMGIYGLSGGYNSLSFFGGAFEYNRSVHDCYTKLVFFGTRFEFDCLASCTPSLVVRPVFKGSALSESSTVIKYIGCFFLGLNNFAENVQYWISNPYKASSYNIAPFYIVGGSKVSLEMVDCELVDVVQPSGVYYIGCDKFLGHGNYVGGNISDIVNPSNVVKETNGFID